MALTLDAVRALDAIDRHGSFAAAAASLHKAQSAVSYAIKQLETSLDVPLFDRSGHRATLTPAGVAILDEGRYLLARARRMEVLGEQFRDGWEPRLHVVIDGALPVQPIMEVLAELGEDGVPTHIQVTMEFLGGVQRRFERERAQLMLAMQYTPDDLLHAETLADHELILVTSAAHVMAGAAHDPQSLQAYLELAVHDSSDLTAGRDTNSTRGGRVFYLSDFHTKRQGLLMGLGYGWMPVPLVRDDLDAGRLMELSMSTGSRRRITPHLVQRIDRPLGQAGLRLVDGLKRRWPTG